MKILYVTTFLVLSTGLFFTACSNDEDTISDEIVIPDEEVVEPVPLQISVSIAELTRSLITESGFKDNTSIGVSMMYVNGEDYGEGWYIPSLGQLAVIYKYRNQLNAELHRIKAAGGDVNDVISEGYALNWSSTTNGGGSAWVVYFDCGICGTRMQIDESWTRNPNLVRDVE